MDLEQKSIERIKMASEMSLHHYGKPFEVHNSHTTADSPQTVYHIRKVSREMKQCLGVIKHIRRWNYWRKNNSNVT